MNKITYWANLMNVWGRVLDIWILLNLCTICLLLSLLSTYGCIFTLMCFIWMMFRCSKSLLIWMLSRLLCPTSSGDEVRQHRQGRIQWEGRCSQVLFSRKIIRNISFCKFILFFCIQLVLFVICIYLSDIKMHVSCFLCILKLN